MLVPRKKTILFLAANPSNTSRLNLGTEVREIQDGLSQSTYRDNFEFEQVWAARPKDMRRVILRRRPQIVHFSGHGSGAAGLVLEDNKGHSQLVTAQALSDLFELFSDCIECVVLNACYSQLQANAIARHIPYTVGMNQAIGDQAAIEFAVGFYDALGEGHQIEFAFEYGRTSITMQGIPEACTPVLIPQLSGMSYLSSRLDGRVVQAEGEEFYRVNPSQISAQMSDSTVTEKGSGSVVQRSISSEEMQLESLNGAVPLISKFYVSSVLQGRAYEAIHKPGALVRIKGPHGMGKSSLTVRVLEHAKAQGYRTVTLDFEQVNTRFFQDLDKFAQWFCASVGKPLGIRVKATEYWDDIFGPNDNCTDYFEQYLLTGNPLTLALENFDRLFDFSDIEVDFCGMLRGWHEKSKRDASWGQLRLLIVYSQESFEPRDINQSPFNVGLPIELGSWTTSEVIALSNRYGLVWTTDELMKLMDLTGGHPSLVRLLLPAIAVGEKTLSSVRETAATEAGIYCSHLLDRLNYLEKYPELKLAMQQVVASDAPVRLRPQEAYKLYSMGLVKRQHNEVIPLCEVYRTYFRERLIG